MKNSVSTVIALTFVASFLRPAGAGPLVTVEQKPSIAFRSYCSHWFKRLIPGNFGGPYAIYRERTSTRLHHDLPLDLPPPSKDSKTFGLSKDGELRGSLKTSKKYFRSESEFYQFIDLAMSAGYTIDELTLFLRVNGYHRGVEMMLAEFKKIHRSSNSKSVWTSCQNTQTSADRKAEAGCRNLISETLLLYQFIEAPPFQNQN